MINNVHFILQTNNEDKDEVGDDDVEDRTQLLMEDHTNL
jgi:hypothetical protein